MEIPDFCGGNGSMGRAEFLIPGILWLESVCKARPQG
jgi:hypothetical protein